MSIPDGNHKLAEADTTLTIAHALALDASDKLAGFRSRFYIPSKADLKRKTLVTDSNEPPSDECIYLCGNSLGLQPKSTPKLVSLYLTQWRTKAVLGHFVEDNESPVGPWLHTDALAARLMAPLVGAMESEVAIMGTLTSNLHLLLCSFYRPVKSGRYKILLEGKAFPSDHFAVQSQVEHHGFDADDALILLEPSKGSSALTTEQICTAIDMHAHELAMVLLPGIQFYSGQYFDIQTVTSHAHSKGILIGWDCAHAAGNVDLKLHDWQVDFAVWCSYKYLNAGPGAISGLFVHERHGLVDMSKPKGHQYRHRMAGWWGDDKSSRFQMTNQFTPIPGAAGYQVSNPSAIDTAALVASLQIFNEATLPALRAKSVALTAYLEHLLQQPSAASAPYTIITPSDPYQRGAQLSIKLGPSLLETVLECLEEDGVVVDERKPDVVRVAPAPLFNTFVDVYHFVRIFRRAVEAAVERRDFGLRQPIATEMTIT